MEEIDPLDSPQLIEAVLLWAGWGYSWPDRDESRVVQRFGPEIAVQLLATIRFLEDEFYKSNANFASANLKEMGNTAIKQFKEKHPGVADEIADVLAWCYTFDYK